MIRKGVSASRSAIRNLKGCNSKLRCVSQLNSSRSISSVNARHWTPSTSTTISVAATRSLRNYASELPAGAIELAMPSLSPTMTKGNIAKWRKNEGDKVKVGEVLCEIETDKATLDLDSTEAGYLAKILVPGGTNDVQIGTAIAILVEEQADVAKVKDYQAKGVSAPKAAATPAPAEKAAATPSPATSAAPQQQQQQASSSAATGGRVFASPLARAEAAQNNINLAEISSGSGPSNRIIKADVESFLSARSAAPAPAAASAAAAAVYTSFTDVATSNVRKVIAQRLLESKRTIPHYYLTVEITMDKLLEVRTQLNNAAPKNKNGQPAYKLSVNDFIIKASALACRKVPAANSSWMDSAIRQYNNVDINVAVQTDNGLVTPFVADADKLGLEAISNQVKALAEKARAGKLTPEEYQGGSFTISNLGMFGIKQFAAIINPPQACILAVGAAEKKVVPNEDKATAAATPFKVATVVNITLSCDHRVVDGAVGAEWLQAFKSYVESPLSLLL